MPKFQQAVNGAEAPGMVAMPVQPITMPTPIVP